MPQIFFKSALYCCLVVLLVICTSNTKAQSIFIGFGPVHSHTKQTIKLVNGKDALVYLNYQKYIGYNIPSKRKYNISMSVANYEVAALMRLKIGAGIGFTGARVTRFDIGLGYNLLKQNNRIFIKPSFAIGFQFARKLGDLWGEQVHIYGPDYYQTRISYSEGHNNFQFVPVAGLSTGVKFLKRCEAGISIQGVWGYKTFQRMYFFYNHKDTPTIERTAIFESRGTGINSAIFLGVNIGKKSKLNESNNHAR